MAEEDLDGICLALRDLAASDLDLEAALPTIASLVGRDRRLAHDVARRCVTRAGQQPDQPWARASRLVERAIELGFVD